MTTRIGDFTRHALLTSMVQKTQGRMADLQMAIASGKKAQKYDAIAGDVPVLLSTHFDRRLTSAHIDQNLLTVDRMQAMDGTLKALGDIAERARTLLVQRLDGTVGDAVPLDTELDTMLEQIEARLNLRVDGRYLFAGSRTDTKPVEIPDPPPTTADSSTYYQGDEIRLKVRAEADIEIEYGIPASDSAFERLIGAIGLARRGHLANDRGDLENALDLLGQAVEKLSDLRGELGSKRSRLEAVIDIQRGDAVYFDDIINRLENTDISEAMSRLAQDRTVLEASYVTISRISQLSIADFLR